MQAVCPASRNGFRRMTIAPTVGRYPNCPAHNLRRASRIMSLDPAILHAALTRTGKSQADVARAMQVSKATVSRWFSGTGEPETVDRLRELAAVLELSLAAMCGEDAAANERERLLLKMFREQDPTHADALLALLASRPPKR